MVKILLVVAWLFSSSIGLYGVLKAEVDNFDAKHRYGYVIPLEEDENLKFGTAMCVISLFFVFLWMIM